MFFRRRREPGWMAIRAGGEQIDVAHIVAGSNCPRVRFCRSYHAEGRVAEALKRLRRQLRLDDFRCSLVLEPDRYQVHQVPAPAVPAAELKAAVRWSVKDLVDYPIESAAVDAVAIPGEGGLERAQQVLAVTASAEAVRGSVRPFHEAGLPLEAIDVPELAQRNIAALFEPEHRALALLAFGPEGGLLTITAGGELFVARRIEIPLERLIDADADQRAQYLDRIALELQRSLDNFDRQYGFVTLAKLLLTPVPGQTGLLETLRANLYVPVEEMDLATVLDLGGEPELTDTVRHSACLAVIGAALRDAGPGR